MKIDAMSGYPVYRKNAAGPAHKTNAPSENTAKTDVVEFSHSQATALDKDLVTLKSGILRDAARPASPEKLAALKESIREGSYRRSTDELVNAILGDE